MMSEYQVQEAKYQSKRGSCKRESSEKANSHTLHHLKNNFHLNAQRGSPGYTVFGKVTNGWEVIEDIAGSDTSPRQGISAALPDIPVIILRARRL